MRQAQRKTRDYLRRRWSSFQAPLLGIAIGLTLFLGVHAVSPHPGQSCGRLGQLSEEWELGMPTHELMCVATTAGDLRYGGVIMPGRKRDAR